MIVSANNVPVLYSFRRCPYAMRARLALAISKTRIELREVKLSAKPAELLAASPKATVPVLALSDGTIIEQSLDIMHFALNLHDPEFWLKYCDSDLIAQNDGYFKHHLDRYKYPDRHMSDAQAHRLEGLNFLLQLEHGLAQTGYLSGPSRGLTDAAIAPFVRQFAAVDREWFANQPLPKLQEWLKNFEISALFAAISVRVEPWTPEQPALILDWM